MSADADNTLERFGIPADDSEPELLVERREQATTEDADLDGSITDDVAAGELSNPASFEGPPIRVDGSGRKTLRRCPVCQTPFSSTAHRQTHVSAHDPEDFGLATVGEGRRHSSDDIWAETDRPYETGDYTLPWRDGDE